ncbi:MAG: (Fe-S)-binding protein [Myxococcaceae bacterium]|nr:(Fe-S)-binding protein [Myxococcaceae bacterium]
MNDAFLDKRRDLALCALCPGYCAASCPVLDATGNSALSPGAKIALLQEIVVGHRRLDESAARVLFACTGCGRCAEVCPSRVDVPELLRRARAVCAEEGESPSGVERLRTRMAQTGNPFGADLSVLSRALSDDGEGRVYFPGCTALAREQDFVRGAIDAAAGFNLRLTLTEMSASCCGYPLFAAGLVSEFTEHARAFARRVDHLSEFVVGDPGCMVAFTRLYRKVGVELRARPVFILKLLEDRLDHAFGRAPLSLRLTYHEACKLRCELDCRDAPRRLLRAAVGDFRDSTPETSACSGGGGLISWSHPDIAADLVALQRSLLDGKSQGIVTACPSALHRFHSAGLKAVDLYSVLARWIAFRDGDL